VAENKTQATAASVDRFLDAVPDPVRRADARTLHALMARLSGERARMWGPSIVGFGKYRYKYDSGREGESCRIGFSPRKAELVLYVLGGDGGEAEALARLGRQRTGKGCLYIRKLADVDMDTLEALIRAKLARMDAAFPR
jgi:hypothetical protein